MLGRISLEEARDYYIKAQNIYQFVDETSMWFDIEDSNYYIHISIYNGPRILYHDSRDNNSLKNRVDRIQPGCTIIIKENGVDIMKPIFMEIES